MTDPVAPRESLVDQVLLGDGRELKLLAASGILPLAPEELIFVQVKLTRSEDAEVAQRATQALESLDVRQLTPYLGSDADQETLDYFARESEHPTVLETILQRRDVSRDLLVELARKLPPDLQEILLLRQDAIMERTEILDALAENPGLSSYSQRRIDEYRRHLLGPIVRQAAEPAEEPFDLDSEAVDEPSEEELEAALAMVGEEIEPEGLKDETTGLTEGQIRGLAVPMRVKLARGASRGLRSILIRDTNTLVVKTVLTQSSMSDQEVEQIANSRNVVDDVLIAIANRREWIRKYAILLAVVRNPLTPMGIVVRLIPRLSVRDLQSLSKDRNVSEGVRSTAGRLYRAKRK